MHVQALRYLVAVVEEGHFGRAAERMHVSQPSISQAILRLEQQFGTALLDRSGGRVVPTSAGSRVIAEVESALTHLDRAVDAARAPAEARTLRIGCTPFFSMWVTIELLTPFRQAHPEIEVSVRERDVPTQAKALLAADIDVAVGEPLAPDDRFRASVIREDPCAVWVSLDHPLTALDEVPLRALAGLPVSDGDPVLHPGYHAWIRAAFLRAGVEASFAAPGQDSPSTISRIIEGSLVAVAADIAPEGSIPGVAVRRISDPVRWPWTTTVLATRGHEPATTFVAWAASHPGSPADR